MFQQVNISQTEKRILQNLHLKGCIGKCGSLTKKERETILNGLIKKELLTQRCTLTKLGIEYSAPGAGYYFFKTIQ
jgi:hypothetical protein